MNIALKFAYDGRNFHGYARQPELRTVEGEIIKALVKNSFIEDTKQSCFRSASRTDKGVSALSNVVSFNTNCSKKNVLDSLSNEFEDIVFYGMKEVDSDFKPRYAKLRQYSYYLPSNNLDVEKIIQASSIFAGEHDFSNFARVEEHKNPIRNIENILFTEGREHLIIDFYAQTFLWQQIRRIVASLEKIGNGKLEKEQVLDALDKPEIKVDFGLAPAEPLVLKDIIYDFNFELDERLFIRAKELIAISF